MNMKTEIRAEKMIAQQAMRLRLMDGILDAFIG